MAFEIRLFSFSKRENSTKRPSDDGTSYNCNIKSQSSILNPTIELDIGLSNAPNEYNYAYIPAYQRYYYINEWVNNQPLWIAHLSVDALATWKSNIGSTSLYVLRSSASSDGNIIDTMYPTKANTTRSKTDIVKLHNSIPGQTGSIVCGIVSKSDGIASLFQAQYGGVKYLAFSHSGLNTISDALLDADSLQAIAGLEEDDATIELQKSLIDPMQYIKSAVWIPVSIGTSSKSLDINGWTVPNVDYGYVSLIPYHSESKTIDIPKHPAAATRGNYLNTAPYTRLWLDVQPYGTVELDTTITANIDSLTLEETVDLITGQGFLTIKTSDGVILNRLSSQLGVEIQLSQVTRGKMGSVLSGVAGWLGNIGSMFGNESPSEFKSARINNATDAWIGKQTSGVGGTGGFAGVSFQWSMNAEFFTPVNEDNVHNGRPLCQMATPSSLGGYMLIQDGDVSIPGTKNEMDAIKTSLESGFYYE